MHLVLAGAMVTPIVIATATRSPAPADVSPPPVAPAAPTPTPGTALERIGLRRRTPHR
jgi:hypothetical protein